MSLSILHLSDLHRDPGNPIRNDVLLDSLENDRRHYSTEESPVVRSPDLIIVSGDIVQGIRYDVSDPEEQLRQQYQEALDFIGRLTDRFLEGDRTRVVIVPGNHDVSAYHFQKSLLSIAISPDRKRDLITQLFSPSSMLRWSWTDLELYEIADQAAYAKRMEAFADFYQAFYGGMRTYDLDPAKQIDVFDYPAFDLTVVGFSSCYNNDLMNKQGAIHPGCMADAGTRLRQPLYDGRFRIAVWHHNVEGPPTHTDYMDPDLIQNLIDRGFSLGFHGHQHRPQFIDTRFRHGVARGISVISAGTLCGGASFRFGRAYNVIEIDIHEGTGRLHVREMQNDNLSLPIWGRRAIHPERTAFYKFHYDPPPVASVRQNGNTAALIQAERLFEAGEYREAADILVGLVKSEPLARRLLLESLVRVKDSRAVVDSFDPPEGEAEAIHLMDALWAEGNRDRLRELLTLPAIVESQDPSLREIRRKYAARVGT